jgi:hypothetical protein
MPVLWRPDKPTIVGRASRVAPCRFSQWQDARIAATDPPVPCSIRQCMAPVQSGAAARQRRETSGGVRKVAIRRCVKPPSLCVNGGHLLWLGRSLHVSNTTAADSRTTPVPRHVATRHDSGTGLEAVVGQAPRLWRAAGHGKPCGCLARGAPLGRQPAIPCQESSAVEARPALGAILMATVLCLAYGCSSSLPTTAPPL